MQAAVFHAPRDVRVDEVPQPAIGLADVLVRVAACGICGTDLRIEAGEYDAVYPVIPGHEFAGVVEDVGPDAGGLRPGQWVVVNPNCPCRRCRYCSQGRFNLCEAMTACGVTYNGGFAEWCRVAGQLALPVSQAIPLEHWALMEPVSCCLHGIDVAGVRPGDRVAILGGGSIGLILLQLARLASASQLIVTEPRAEKRALAEQLGADTALDPAALGGWLAAAVRELTEGGADVVIEAAGLPATAELALELPCKGGTVLFFGVCAKELALPLRPNWVYHNEISIRGTFTNPLTDTRAIGLLTSGRVRVGPLITHRFSLADIREGLGAVRRGETVKAVVVP
ncbi:MAG: zinc-dependent alcohol dehydrogenase family protein [Armatimonadetes bacterium]|nr:zinc-dependent alcohol dehydrogenase family protein [Armatimonadota bacterium]